MWNFYAAEGLAAGTVVLIALISFWSLVWKGIALWKCGRKNQLVWFIFILILNTAGILPIIYLIFFQKKPKKAKKKTKKKKK
ncbi:hypothetical protein GF361_05225 [Candidatus Woesearchaeota archaeon]|nr:hypothetical protein [Candidatus Woesearchaeota archaeon]